MATALDPFSMFTLTTGPAYLSSSRTILNGVLKHNYLCGRLMRGKPLSQVLQGGSEIKDVIYLEADSDAEFYSASDQDFDYRNQQVGQAHKADWRFLKNSTSWTDHEVGLNEGGSLSEKAGAFHRFKYYRDLKLMNLWQTTIDKMEDQLFAQANSGEMESATGKQPYSIPASITDRSNGLPRGSDATFTTVQGLSSSTYTNWANQREVGSSSGGGYVVSSGSATGEAFWQGCRKIWTKCNFDGLPKFGEYAQPRTSPDFVACSLWGLTLAEGSLRDEQDMYLAGRQDAAFPYPQFHGTPFVYVDTLDDAALYTDNTGTGTTLSDEADSGSIGANFYNGPRFWFINGMRMSMVWHRDRFFKKIPPFSPDREPFKKVLVVDNWYNLVNQNRREHGILGPNADVTSPSQPS